MITNAAARPGDWLVLTKPLGTGIITTGIKRGITSPATARKAVAVMCRLNTVGAEVAERRLVRAGTDVTGFGLLGHLGSLCRASGVGAEIFTDKLPIIAREVLDLIARDCLPGGSRENLKTADAFVQWNGATEAQKYLLTDAQTSGGLLLCVPPRKLAEVLETLKEHRTACVAVIGQIVRIAKARIRIVASPNRSP
jgi:selenide,water dikinase